MAVDGITMRAKAFELKTQLLQGKVTRIFQPQKLLIKVEIRQDGKNHWLLICVDPSYPRLHLTGLHYENPTKAPDFCMLLRKYIQYSIITQIKQVGMDRILEIHLLGRDEEERTLVVEIMGHHSNLILLHQGFILGSIKKVTSQVSRYRQVLPGLYYERPPTQQKENPLTQDPEELIGLFQGDRKAYQILLDNLQGLGPLTAKELLLRSGIDPLCIGEMMGEGEKLAFRKEFISFQRELSKGNFSPSIIIDEKNQITAYSALSLTSKPPLKRKDFSSLKDLFDYLYVEKIQRERLGVLSHSLSSKVNSFFKRGKKRLKDLKKDLKKGTSAYEYKVKGDLLTTNIYQLKKGLKEITLPLLEDPSKEMTITLNPALGAAENAQKYYQHYQKLKKSCHHLEREIRKLQNELKYLKQVLVTIEQANDEEALLLIREELEEEAYLKVKGKKSLKKKDSKPLQFLSSQKYSIFVGRNNKENDYLTMKLAGREDLWLHVKDLAGSHVIIKRHNRDEVPLETIQEAAIIAAYYSKGRSSSKVPVDYTLIKHVQKPKEARPGMVYYKDYSTIHVKPDKHLVEKLKKEV